MARQAAAGITACKVGIRPAWSVEATAVADVEDAAANSEENWTAVLAVEREQRSGRVGAEDFGRRAPWDRRRCVGRRERRVCRVEEDAQKDEVERREG